MDDLVFLYTTWPDAEKAHACGRAAVEARLAACANILVAMHSVYRWKGETREEVETPMLLKTTKGAAEQLTALVLERHPHEVPCIVALPISPFGGHPPFAEWVRGEVR
jgi:periplasmic divalent cation tolerance protein